MYIGQTVQRAPEITLAKAAQPDKRSVASVGGEDEIHEILKRFGRMGGAWTADDVAARLQNTSANGIGSVARSIVDRRLVNIFWNGRYWLPAFQYAHPSLEVRGSVSSILLELTPFMNDWSIAHWFSSPNQWLGLAAPAELIEVEPAEVFHSAREQRFLAKGL